MKCLDCERTLKEVDEFVCVDCANESVKEELEEVKEILKIVKGILNQKIKELEK